MKLTMSHEFDAPIERVWAMFHDPDSHAAKFEDMGHEDVEVLDQARETDRLHIVIRRTVTVDVPSIAKKVLPDTATVTTDDVWRDNGDGTYGGEFLVDMEGVPQETRGRTRLTANDNGTTHYEVELDVKVKVPVIGDRIAKAGKSQMEDQLRAEFRAGDTWLANHADQGE